MSLQKLLAQNLLVTPQHEAYLARTNGEVQLTPDITKWVSEQLQAKQRDRTKSFSASARGTCARQQVYQFIGVPRKDRISTDTAAIFAHGTWTHIKWQSHGFHAGWLARAEVPTEMPKYRLKGTLDGVLTSGDGLEIKSINGMGFKRILESGPKPEHLLQMHAYMLATGIERFSIVYEHKDTQNWKEYVVPFSGDTAQRVTDELDLVNKSVDERSLPVRLPECKNKTGAYRYCPFAELCLASDEWPTATKKFRVKASRNAS